MSLRRSYAPFSHNMDSADHGRAFRVSPLLSGDDLTPYHKREVEDDIQVAAGRCRINQNIYPFEDPSDFLALANGVHRVYISAAGVITVAIVGAYPANSIPLARVTVAAGVVTDIDDDRCFLAGGF